ncbi:MAG: helix-turn-helix domain-containing protein [Acidimicrobiales bacterium]
MHIPPPYRATTSSDDRARWPFAPLMAATGNPTITALARRLGVSPRTVSRWRRAGLSDHQADNAAVTLGYHPLNIWPDWQ